jgi:hypothetical protein
MLAASGLGAGVITHAFGCYQLHLPPEAWIDIEAADAAADRAKKAIAEEIPTDGRTWASVAAAIARRIFLPGEDGLWVEEKRADLVVVLRRALDVSLETALAPGDTAEAAAVASEAVTLEPYREHAKLLAPQRSGCPSVLGAGQARRFARWPGVVERAGELGRALAFELRLGGSKWTRSPTIDSSFL